MGEIYVSAGIGLRTNCVLRAIVKKEYNTKRLITTINLEICVL